MILLHRYAPAIVLCMSLFISLLAGDVAAQTYYVAPNGSNSRTLQQAEDPATPWKSIQVALDRAGSGSSIVVRDGNYWGHFDFRCSNVTLRSENREGAVLIGSIYASDLNDLRVEGFEIINRRPDAPRSKGLSFFRCHHIVVRNNRIHDCRGGGISLDQSDHLLVEWNVVFRNAFFETAQHSGISVYQPQRRGPDDSGAFSIVVRNNTSFSNENYFDNPDFGRPTDGNGIVIDDSQNQTAPTGNGQLYSGRILVENNLCFLNGGQGIHCYQSENVYIRNNTCYKNMKSFDFGGEISVVRGNQVLVYNNLLVAREGKNAGLQYEGGFVWWDYNLLYNGPTQNVSNGSHTVYAPPGFRTDELLKLDAGSPAINAGLTHFGGFPFDVDGLQRIVDGAIDIGCKERQF